VCLKYYLFNPLTRKTSFFKFPVPLQYLHNFTYARGNGLNFVFRLHQIRKKNLLIFFFFNIVTLLRSIEREILSRKESPKLISWMVSNCQTYSLREVFVDKLKQFTNVDVFGDCGSLVCDKSDHKSCLKKLVRLKIIKPHGFVNFSFSFFLSRNFVCLLKR